MKNLVILAFLLIPSVSLAAPLTVDQSNSLISVVQSSTSTPASAFVPLITSFSNITAPQAESLITVVQAAPGVPAASFVNMLIAFTVDPTPVLGATQPTQPTQQPQTQPVNNPPATTTPVVQSPPMPPSSPTIDAISIDAGVLHVSSVEPLDINATILPAGVTLGTFDFNDKRSRIGQSGVGHGYGVHLNGLPAEFTPIDITLVGTNGGQITKSVVVRL